MTLSPVPVRAVFLLASPGQWVLYSNSSFPELQALQASVDTLALQEESGDLGQVQERQDRIMQPSYSI